MGSSIPPGPPDTGELLLLGREGMLIVTDFKWPRHVWAGNTQPSFP